MVVAVTKGRISVSFNSLSPEEKNYAERILSTSRYDSLWYELSCLIPCSIIVVLGMINDSFAAIGAGAFVYLLFQLRTIIYQTKQLPQLQSILSKLEKEDSKDPR